MTILDSGLLFFCGPPCRKTSTSASVATYLARPVGHDVRRRRPEVNVIRDGGENDGRGDERHREQQVLRQQRYDERILRNDFGEHQKEDGERQQHVDAQRHLLVTVGRNIEDEDGDEGVRDERDDEVDGVEEELSPYDDVEAPHRKRLFAARVADAALFGRRVDDVELGVLVELAEVDAALDSLDHLVVALGRMHGRRAVAPRPRLVVLYVHLFSRKQHTW